MVSSAEIEMRYHRNNDEYDIALLFSANKHRFVKPHHKKGDNFYYLGFKGRYIRITSKGNAKEPVMKWNILLIELIESGEYNVITEVTWITPTEQSKRTIPILKDIEIPPYSRYPYDLFDKVYQKSDVELLLKGGIQS